MIVSLEKIDWTWLRSFLAVVECGSHSAAALEIGVTQPTIGRHIQLLEAELGEILFTRQSRGMIPSPFAQSLIEPARAMKKAGIDFVKQAEAQHTRETETIRLTASRVMSQFVLPPILAKMRNEMPGLQIELVPSDDSKNLLFHEADIAVRMHPSTQNELVQKKMGQLNIDAIASAEYIQNHGQPRDIHELIQHPLIGYDRNTLIIDGMRPYFPQISPEHFVIRCDDQIVYFEFVAQGCGIGFAPRILPQYDPRLIALNLIPEGISLPVYLVAGQSLNLTARVRHVFDFLDMELRGVFSNASP